MRGRWQPGLFARYAALITALVAGLVVVTSLVHGQLARTELLAQVQLLQAAKAAAAATQIEGFVQDLDQQLGWIDPVANPAQPESATSLRLDFIRLMRQVPAFASLTWIGPDGLERLHVSRIQLDRVASGQDLSARADYQAAAAGRTYYSPVAFFQDSEPFLTLAKPLAGGGIVSAEVNLKFIWDVVARLSSAESDNTYVVASDGSLVAHLDLAAVLGKVNVAALPQVAGARRGSTQFLGKSLSGDEVYSAHVLVPTLAWLVFVDSPVRAHQGAFDAALRRTLLVLAVAVLVAVVAAFLLARTLVKPLRLLQSGAAAVGEGRFDQPIALASGDELQQLADSFNRMALALKTSYEQLEDKVVERTQALELEKQRSHALLHTLLPPDIADELVRTGRVQATRHASATLLFTDFAGFTAAASTMPPDVLVAELNEIFAAFDRICQCHGVDRIKTIGDAYMAAAGVTASCEDHAQRCVRAAQDMVAFLEQRNTVSAFKWHLRVGVHSGPVIAGVLGTHKLAFDVWGDTVNLAARMESAGAVGRINVSAYTYHLIQSEFACSYRGRLSAKGKGEVDMYFVDAPQTAA